MNQHPSVTKSAPYDGSVWDSGLIALGAVGLFLVMLGGGWDIAWHIALGRDTFWSPPHLVLYTGILLVLGTMGLGLLQVWRLQQAGRTYNAGPTVTLPPGLRINAGLFMAGVGALMSLSSAPIDDFWHQVFGVDVTIWSPPHLQLIFGLALTAFGLMAALVSETNQRYPERLRSALPALSLDLQNVTLHLLGAYFVLILLSLLDEYHFDVPQYSLAYYPVLLAPLAIGSLMAVTRAAGTCWSATVTSAFVVVLQLVLGIELTVVGLSAVKTFWLLLPVAGLVIDLLWARYQHIFRPRLVAGIAAIATAVYVPTQLASMGWLTQVHWQSLALALATGTLGGLIGARIGKALRPGVELHRQRVTHPVRAREAGIAVTVVLLFLVGVAVTQAHGAAPSVEVRLSDPHVIAGQPVELEVIIQPAEAISSPDQIKLILGRAEEKSVVSLEPSGTPGRFKTLVTPSRPGQWFVALSLQTEHEEWFDWFLLQVAPAGDASAPNPEHFTLVLVPDQTPGAREIPANKLRMGKILVSLWIVVLTVVSLYGLHRIEQAGLALAGSSS